MMKRLLVLLALATSICSATTVTPTGTGACDMNDNYCNVYTTSACSTTTTNPGYVCVAGYSDAGSNNYWTEYKLTYTLSIPSNATVTAFTPPSSGVGSTVLNQSTGGGDCSLYAYWYSSKGTVKNTTTTTLSNLAGVTSVTWLARHTPANSNVTCDKTSVGDNTSNNTITITYTVNGTPVTVSVTGVPANVNYGVWFTPTFICRDPDGYANISQCRVIIGYGVDDKYTCDLIYYPGTNSLGNRADSLGAWQNQTVGTGGATASNSYCTLDIAGSTSTRSGTDATVVPRLYVKPPILTHGAGALNSYMYVADASNATAGWNTMSSGGYARSGPKLIITSNH